MATMPVSAYQAVSHFQENQRRAIELIETYQQLDKRCQATIEQVRAQMGAAATQLAAAYLPRLDPESLARVEPLTGYMGFSRRDPIKAMQHERHVLEVTLDKIWSDERYQNRELLAGPDGTLTTQMAEIQDTLAMWEAECAPFEQLDMFLELIAVKYDTPEFNVGWWKSMYWKYWAAGDRICSALGMKDFGDDVLPAYRKVTEQRDFWRGEAEGVGAKLREVHELVQRHDESVDRLARLEEIYLQHCHTLLAEYLCEADPQLLSEWHRGDAGAAADGGRAITMGLRVVSGLKAKIAFLSELHGDGLSGLIADLQRRVHKYGRKSAKFSRPKYFSRLISERDLDPAFGAKYEKLRQRERALARLIDRVDGYDDYARFDLANDPDLWWVEFTGKQPTRLTPRLRQWYDRNPDVRPIHDSSWHDHDDDHHRAQAVATAMAARELDDVGYLS